MWVKICGLTTPADLPAILAAAPDAVGLNFYAGSKRCVAPEAAREIVAGLPDAIEPVGVFVNHSPAEIRSICARTGLRTVQFHGEETWEQIAELSDFRLIRAFRVKAGGLDDVERELDRAAALGLDLFACLADAAVPGTYGGAGQRAPWDVIADWKGNAWPRLILAGGLTPANVVAAIARVNPWGVDVASGVESAPGKKDPHAIGEFVAQARSGTTAGS